MADEKKKRFVEFEEVGGEGVALLFTFVDCKTLQERLGDGWFNDAPSRIDRYDMEWMETYLRVGGKDAKRKPRPIKIEEIQELTTAEVAVRILDALFLSVHGDAFVDYQIRVAKMIADAQKEGTLDENPPKDPGTSSNSSSDTPSGSDLSLQN